MAEADNIHKFDRYTAQILADLYREFPIRKSLDPWSYAMVQRSQRTYENGRFTGIVVDENGAEQDVDQTDVQFVTDTLIWLSETGLITGGEHPYYQSWESATLTYKGLELMKSVPASVSETSGGVGDALLDLIEKGASQAAAKLVSRALTSAPRLAMDAALTYSGLGG